MSNKLEVDSIQFNYGSRTILSDIFINCSTGLITGLLGRNGQGKSTLLNIIFGNLKGNYQSIRINDVPFERFFKNQSLHINYLPQFNFVPNNTKIKNVFRDFDIDYQDFVNCFPEFENREGEMFCDFSGGAKRIIEIYIIVKSNTLFTILDEPFSYLMPKHIEIVKDLIKSESSNKGFILTDHLYKHILEMSDQNFLLNNGKTYCIQSIEELEKYGYLIGR